MTASNARMFRVQLSDRPDDSALLSEAEIAELRAAFARRQQENTRVPAGVAELAEDVDSVTMPNFNATDAEILANQQKAVAPKDKPAQINQRLFILIGGLVVSLVLVALSLVSGSGRSAAPLLAPATAAATVAATAPPTAPPTVGADVPTVEAYFDYRDTSSSTAITITGMLRIDGKAGDDWRLVVLSGGRSSVWVTTKDVPVGLSIADPLPDLAPRPTSPPVLARAPVVPGGSSGGGDPAAPARCEVEADIRFTTERDVTIQNPSGTTNFLGHVVGRSCSSQAEADRQADIGEQEIIARYYAHPTPTMPPTATPPPPAATVGPKG